MALPRPNEFSSSICTLSWIDGATGLPENDEGGPPDSVLGSDLRHSDDRLPFRILNLLEARITVTESGQIASYDFTEVSSLYCNPSFLKTDSFVFPAKQSAATTPGGDYVVFEQTAGARTEAPEKIGGAVGGLAGGVGGPIGGFIGRGAGNLIAHAVSGFPPIWTTLRLTMYADGRVKPQLICHSLFPSLSYYTPPGEKACGPYPDVTYRRVSIPYDAKPNLERWKERGWGPIPSPDPAGPTEGNPWGYTKVFAKAAAGKK
jgi:hypothetical protein